MCQLCYIISRTQLQSLVRLLLFVIKLLFCGLIFGAKSHARHLTRLNLFSARDIPNFSHFAPYFSHFKCVPVHIPGKRKTAFVICPLDGYTSYNSHIWRDTAWRDTGRACNRSTYSRYKKYDQCDLLWDSFCNFDVVGALGEGVLPAFWQNVSCRSAELLQSTTGTFFCNILVSNREKRLNDKGAEVRRRLKFG